MNYIKRLSYNGKYIKDIVFPKCIVHRPPEKQTKVEVVFSEYTAIDSRLSKGE